MRLNLLNYLLAGGRLLQGHLVFLLAPLLIFNFSFDEMENLRLSLEEEGVTEDIFAGVLATLVEAVHVELPDERVDVSVSEVLGQDVVLEVVDLFDGKLPPVVHPVNYSLVVLVLQDVETLLDEVCHRCIRIIP